MPQQILPLLHAHAWTALAALVIGLLALTAKSPAIGSPLARIPRQWRPHVVLCLGVASGILSAVVAGTPWLDALVGGIVSAGLAVLVHGVAGGLSPADELLPGQVRVTAPQGATVSVDAVLGGAPAAGTSLPAVLVPSAPDATPPPVVVPPAPAAQLDFGDKGSP